MRYGLIGGNLQYSYSPRLHRLLGADYDYQLFELAPAELEPFLRNGGIGGLNVTIPYKRTVLPYCDWLSPTAAQSGSVNTLLFSTDGKISGYNTDYDGFAYQARLLGVNFWGRKVLILGSGGTSHTVKAFLANQQAGQTIVISRRGPDHYGNLQQHADADIIINTTPVGMMPDLAALPLDLELFANLQAVLDVIYTPLRSRLVLTAQEHGVPALGGLPMLVAQAQEAVQLFSGLAPAADSTGSVLQTLTAEAENIALIGMPGAGKSSVAKVLAAQSGRPLYDTDEMIEQQTGQTIPQLFALKGEAYFRILEQQAVREACAGSGRVIACGGGTILNAENCLLLHQNSRCYWLQRCLAKLESEGRPLSYNLEEMYQKRSPLYQKQADAVIENETIIEDAAQRLWAAHFNRP